MIGQVNDAVSPILDNHLHVVERNRPDWAAAWTDEEVVQRWWHLCPERREPDGSPAVTAGIVATLGSSVKISYQPLV